MPLCCKRVHENIKQDNYYTILDVEKESTNSISLDKAEINQKCVAIIIMWWLCGNQVLRHCVGSVIFLFSRQFLFFLFFLLLVNWNNTIFSSYLRKCARSDDNLINGHSRNHGNARTGDAPTQNVSPVGINVTFVFQWFIIPQTVEYDDLYWLFPLWNAGKEKWELLHFLTI